MIKAPKQRRNIGQITSEPASGAFRNRAIFIYFEDADTFAKIILYTTSGRGNGEKRRYDDRMCAEPNNNFPIPYEYTMYFLKKNENKKNEKMMMNVFFFGARVNKTPLWLSLPRNNALY